MRTFRTREQGLMKSLIKPLQDLAPRSGPVSQIGAIEYQERPLRSFTRRVWKCQQLSYWQTSQDVALFNGEKT